MFPQSFQNSDGLPLHCWETLPSVSHRGRIILVHGFGEHSRSLPCRFLTGGLLARGLAVCAFDLRGHGLSPGPRMFAPTWETLRGDVSLFADLVRASDPAAPLFLIGNSLGGLLALDHALHHPGGLRGVAALAPALDATGVPWPVRLAVPVLSRLAPRLSIDPGLDLASISRDAEAVASYLADPLFQRRTTPRLGAEVLRAMRATRALAPRLRVPLLILHGEADRVVPPAGSAAFLAEAGSSDKTRLIYPGAGHNLPLETCRSQVLEDLGRWIEQRAVSADLPTPV